MTENPTYEALLAEVMRLRAENAKLKKRLGLPDAPPKRQLSGPERIALFMSLFSGRQDVYAHRWESKNGQKGYSPACVNEWKKGICGKPQVKCAECPNRQFVPITKEIVFGHLDTRNTDVKKIIGLYPIREDNTVSLLCADFDDKSCEHGYQNDALAFANVAREWGIGCHLERSRSGNGAHVWIFFAQPIRARKARQLGYAILAEAMRRRGQISLKSYDRFFPNQDQLPEGGFGNLVALPLQGMARLNGNSVFVDDKRNNGHAIKVNFKGELRTEQKEAVDALLSHDTGVLHATTAFGKTVAAIGLIAERKVNTLILVHTKALLDQWKERLESFLEIDYTEPDTTKKRGRKKAFSPFGTLDSSGNTLHGLVDIALIQSCVHDSEAGAKDFVRDYGMVIVDECHHVSAVSFERVLKHVNAKYVYGLTATPTRNDGQQPIIFMQCGPIRYTADAKQQIASQDFERILIPRFTSYRHIDDDDPKYTQIISSLMTDEMRNQLIVFDIIKAITEKRSPIVLTSIREHVDILAKLLKEKSPDTTVITLIGSASSKEKRAKMDRLQSVPSDEPLAIIATDKYVGEGFDCPRLDTLFMTMPMSWKGRVQQCAGRLHRDYPGKKEARIYDYIDIHVPVASRMYYKRLKGYVSIGYSLTTQSTSTKTETQTIFNCQTYFAPYLNDINSAKRSIVISMPEIWLPQFAPMLEVLQTKASEGISVRIYTSPKKPNIQRLQAIGLHCTVTSAANISFVIIDSKIVWYGNSNYLAHTQHKEDEHTIRIPDQTLASSLMDHLSPDPATHQSLFDA